MIFLDSRYVDGPLFKANHPRKPEVNVGVFRAWPDYETKYFTYEWVETDRIDVIAHRFLGDSSLWWTILDINPEITNPLEIAPGTQIRIPNA
jgi:hypothetical protein